MESFSPEATGLAKFGVRLLRKRGEEAGYSETASSERLPESLYPASGPLHPTLVGWCGSILSSVMSPQTASTMLSKWWFRAPGRMRNTDRNQRELRGHQE